MIDDKRHIIGITFRVSVEAEDVDPEVLRNAVQQHVDHWTDGRRPMLVEQALDCCQRMVVTAAQREARRDEDVAVYHLDNDTTVSIEPFPTLKTGKYRVIYACPRLKEGYELSGQDTFETFDDAEQYARHFSDNGYATRIVTEVETASL
jgi:hypothetical protein